MWAAKLLGEGATLVRACRAMCDFMKKLGIAVDGGKDSLSMATRVGDWIVKCPGWLKIPSSKSKIQGFRVILIPFSHGVLEQRHGDGKRR